MLRKFLSLFKKSSIINCICIILAFILVNLLSLYSLDLIKDWNNIRYDTTNISINSEEDVLKYMNSINSESPLYLHKFAYSSTGDKLNIFEGVSNIYLSSLNVDDADVFRSVIENQINYVDELKYNTIFVEDNGVNVPFLYISSDKMYINTYLVYDLYNSNDGIYGWGSNSAVISYILEDVSRLLLEVRPNTIKYGVFYGDETWYNEIISIPILASVLSYSSYLQLADPIFSSRAVMNSSIFYINIGVFILLFSVFYFLLREILYTIFRNKDKAVTKTGLIIVSIPFVISHFTYILFIDNSGGFYTPGIISTMGLSYYRCFTFIIAASLGCLFSIMQYRKYKRDAEEKENVNE